jgi:hypothetical protein
MITPKAIKFLKAQPTRFLWIMLDDAEHFIPHAIEDNWPEVSIQDVEEHVSAIKSQLARRGKLA